MAGLPWRAVVVLQLLKAARRDDTPPLREIVVRAVALAVPALGVLAARVRAEQDAAVRERGVQLRQDSVQLAQGDVEERRVGEDAVEAAGRQADRAPACFGAGPRSPDRIGSWRAGSALRSSVRGGVPGEGKREGSTSSTRTALRFQGLVTYGLASLRRPQYRSLSRSSRISGATGGSSPCASSIARVPGGARTRGRACRGLWPLGPSSSVIAERRFDPIPRPATPGSSKNPIRKSYTLRTLPTRTFTCGLFQEVFELLHFPDLLQAYPGAPDRLYAGDDDRARQRAPLALGLVRRQQLEVLPKGIDGSTLRSACAEIAAFDPTSLDTVEVVLDPRPAASRRRHQYRPLVVEHPHVVLVGVDGLSPTLSEEVKSGAAGLSPGVDDVGDPQEALVGLVDPEVIERADPELRLPIGVGEPLRRAKRSTRTPHWGRRVSRPASGPVVELRFRAKPCA